MAFRFGCKAFSDLNKGVLGSNSVPYELFDIWYVEKSVIIIIYCRWRKTEQVILLNWGSVVGISSIFFDFQLRCSKYGWNSKGKSRQACLSTVHVRRTSFQHCLWWKWAQWAIILLIVHCFNLRTFIWAFQCITDTYFSDHCQASKYFPLPVHGKMDSNWKIFV